MCRVIVFDNTGRRQIDAAIKLGKSTFRTSDWEDHLELDGRIVDGKPGGCLCDPLTDEEIVMVGKMAEVMLGEDYYVQLGYDNVLNSRDIFIFRGSRPAEAAKKIQEARDEIQTLLRGGAEDMNDINLSHLQGWLNRLGLLIRKHPDILEQVR